MTRHFLFRDLFQFHFRERKFLVIHWFFINYLRKIENRLKKYWRIAEKKLFLWWFSVHFIYHLPPRTFEGGVHLTRHFVSYISPLFLVGCLKHGHFWTQTIFCIFLEEKKSSNWPFFYIGIKSKILNFQLTKKWKIPKLSMN